MDSWIPYKKFPSREFVLRVNSCGQLPFTSAKSKPRTVLNRKAAAGRKKRDMGLFGLSKIKITPKEFVATQLDSIFSAEFVGKQKNQFLQFSRELHLLQKVTPDNYVIEKQQVIFNLLQIAWDRNTPYAVFIESSSIMHDDPRVKAVNFGIYDRSLSRAQEAGMDTFGFVALAFLSQLLPQDVETGNADIAKLHGVYGTEFTGYYMSYEALIKRHKFVT